MAHCIPELWSGLLLPQLNRGFRLKHNLFLQVQIDEKQRRLDKNHLLLMVSVTELDAALAALVPIVIGSSNCKSISGTIG